LIYRPNEESDAGMIELRIADLTNPLGGTFDLSRCGDAEKSLCISTGYRKGKIAANANKIEVWLTPRFLIEKDLRSTAKHFEPIMTQWNPAKAPIGMMFTWGNWNDLSWYDYATGLSMTDFNQSNLYHLDLTHTTSTGSESNNSIVSLHFRNAPLQEFHVHFGKPE